jgi:hypothetical protein
MTTDAIYNDDVGAVKYHFVISQVRDVSDHEQFVRWSYAFRNSVAADSRSLFWFEETPPAYSVFSAL